MPIYELTVERIVAGGMGLMRSPVGVLLAPDLAPGDRVRVRAAGGVRAEVIELVAPGSDRVQPPCEYYGECGGCDFQHLSYRAQLTAKRGIVADALSRIAGMQLDETAIAVHASPPFGYRRRARFHRTAGGRLGFRARASERVVPVDRCLVLHDSLNRMLTTGSKPDAAAELAAIAAEHGVVSGSNDATVALGPIRLTTRPTLFFQANFELLPQLQRSLGEAAQRTAPAGSHLDVVDLYAGVGLLGRLIAATTPIGTLLAVESVAAAAGYARRNLAACATDLHVVVGRAERVAARPEVQTLMSSACVVVDPPRAGLAKALRRQLLDRSPPTLVYLSCDPATLARDVSQLQDAFEIRSIEVFDFFPQTAHVETLVIMERRR